VVKVKVCRIQLMPRHASTQSRHSEPHHAERLRPDGSAGPRAWLTSERLSAMVLAGITLLALASCALLLAPFVPALAWALALGIVIEPLHAALARRWRWRNVTAGLCVLGAAAVLLGPAMAIGHGAAQELAELAQRSDVLTPTQAWRDAIARMPMGQEAGEWIARRVDVDREWRRVSATLAERAATLLTATVWAAVQFLIMLFALFYFLRDCRPTLATLRRYSPLSERETTRLFSQIAAMVYATVYGTLTVSLIQGCLGALIFWWLGVPAPVLWGLVMAVLSLLPMAGSFVVWFPAAVMFALNGDWTRALVLVGWGAAVIGLVDNLLFPRLVGRDMRLHTLPVFFAIVGGVAVIGASGVVLGPILLATTITLLDVWKARNQAGRPAEVPQT
jgi:predicted PurR-regulated permease PerM